MKISFEKGINDHLRHGVFVLFFLILSGCGQTSPTITDDPTQAIRINQIGYYPGAVKKAVIAEVSEKSVFFLIDHNSRQRVYEGQLSPAQQWELSGERVQLADFTDFKEVGTYQLLVPEFGYSYPFEIKDQVLKDAFLGSIKGLYFQRASMALDQSHAGQWGRPIGHPDDNVLYHPSSGHNTGAISAPGGWYDAGDYNKYIVNACFPLGQHYRLFENSPDAVKDNDLNIPESGNGVSDYLDELKYEMDWVLHMQDSDGGVFHKLTTKNFEGMVMPHEAVSQRYIVGKATTATLNFAASCAQASRVFEDMDKAYANRCLEAAQKAYDWALDNPATAFKNPEDISTGEYGDANFDDEWFWANAELFVSTEDTMYLGRLRSKPLDFEFKAGESWTAYMRFLGMFTLLENPELLPEQFREELRTGIVSTADTLVEKAGSTAYFQPIDDFHWGSNSDVLNAAMLMAQAYRLTADTRYLNTARQAADYIFGNNALGVSFVTGFGDATPMFIHHRQSAADGIADPVPGLLSGGPNSRMQDAADGTVYPENVSPMKAWADQEPSYASNEICMNWNAPLTYVLGFLEQNAD